MQPLLTHHHHKKEMNSKNKRHLLVTPPAGSLSTRSAPLNAAPEREEDSAGPAGNKIHLATQSLGSGFDKATKSLINERQNCWDSVRTGTLAFKDRIAGTL